MSENFETSLNENLVRKHLKKFEDLGLESHYDFDELSPCLVTNVDELVKILQDNSPITFRIDEENVLYYKLREDDEEVVFDIDVTKSFAKSDTWLYNKLLPVSSIFPRIASLEISDEMSSFYSCLVVASIFKDDFKEELIETAKDYDFNNWRQMDEKEISFFELLNSWVQLGSKYIKMVSAASKFSLMRERRKKPVPSALQLPKELDLELNKTIGDVEGIRFNFDNIKLSDYERSKMTKLEIKETIKDREEAVMNRLKENPTVYQIWRLLNLNSNNIPPTFLLRFNRMARRESFSVYCEVYNKSSFPETTEEKINLKKIEKQLKRASIRAYLNKLFTAQVDKLIENPEGYVAPDFV